MRFAYSVIATAILSIGVPAVAADSIYVNKSTVRKAQQVLNKQGFRTGVDGLMGARTQAALKRFQKTHDLDPTGQLNRQTLVALGLQPSASAGATDADPGYSAQTIRSVQTTLNDRGFHAGPVNGRLTTQTRKALREFQKSENLEITGRLNPGTLGALGVLTGEPDFSTATIRAVQERLEARGFHPGPADGRLGDETRAALRAFQRSENLEVTGLPNERTLGALGVNAPVARR